MSRIVIWFLDGFLSTFAYICLYCVLSESKLRINWKILLYYLFGVVSVTLVEYYNISIIDNLFFFLYFPPMFYLISKSGLKKIVYYLVIVWFYGAAIDILLILLIALVFFIFNSNIYQDTEFISMFLTFLVSLVVLAACKRKLFLNSVDKLYKKISKIYYSDFLLILFALFVFSLGITMLLNVFNIDMVMLLLIILVLILFLFIVLLKYKISEKENVKYLATLRENNEFYMKIDDENRIFKHNLNAKLLSIKSVSNKKAQALIDDLILQFNKNINFSNGIRIIPYGLNGIIYQKLYSHYKLLNIKINNLIDYDIFDVLKPRRYNVFVEKMILALDNAIEAALKSEDKILNISLYDDESSIYLEIKNTFSDSINIDMIGSKEYSTKGKKRGLGLFSSFRDTEAILSVKVVNNLFISKIIARKKIMD